MTTPYISLVVGARNDHHGGNMLGRMQAFLNGWLSQAKRYGLTSEIIIVEWNPPANRAKLIDSLQWPRDLGPCEVRFVEVPPVVHSGFKNPNATPLHPMIARNTGIRRARGEFVLATSLDTIFSADLMRFLAERRLDRRTLYRVDRHDVANELPAQATADQLLAYCENHTLRVVTRQGGYELGPDGVRALEEKDIVTPEAGIRFGVGWYPVDSGGGGLFRWMAEEAEIIFQRPADTSPCLLIDAEAGPSAGGAPVVVEIADASGFVLASATLKGRCQLRLHIPDQISVARLRLRVQSAGLPLERDARFLNLRLFGIDWEDPDYRAVSSGSNAPHRARPANVRVRAIEPRQVQLELTPGQGASLESFEAELTDPAGNVLFHLAADRMQLASIHKYLLTLNLGFEVSTHHDSAGSVNEERRDPAWLLEVIGTRPSVDWTAATEAPSSFAGQMRNAAHLHTDGCGDFTLLSREDWFALRGYAEFPIWPTHIDSLFCYAAHHAGVREVVLREPMRIFRIDHFSGAGGTPEGEKDLTARLQDRGVTALHTDDVVKWIDQMRRFNAPVIFTKNNWGLADVALTETVVDREHLAHPAQ